MVEAPADAELTAEVRFLAPTGVGHAATAQTLALPAATVTDAVNVPLDVEHTVTGRRPKPFDVGLQLTAERLPDGRV